MATEPSPQALNPRDLAAKAFGLFPGVSIITLFLYCFELIMEQRDQHLVSMLKQIIAVSGGG